MVWSPLSFCTKPVAQEVSYPNEKELSQMVVRLSALPPLVSSREVEGLKRQLREVEAGKRWVLQGGDCAESFADCNATNILSKLKILLQMSLIIAHRGKKPVIRIGRMAGQYAKPRSQATETRDGLTLPSYFGDLVNRSAFDPESRRPDPELLLQAYMHSAATLNFVRSLTTSGLVDHSYVDSLVFAPPPRSHIDTSHEIGVKFTQLMGEISEDLKARGGLSHMPLSQPSQVDVFTSHEGLQLNYEAALTRQVPHRRGYYNLATHMPWIGDRTRGFEGAHVEYFRGIENPVGVKLGPGIDPLEWVELCRRLSPKNEPGKVVAITRMGKAVSQTLPPLLEASLKAGLRVVWLCDPMHGNTRALKNGKKTRDFSHILTELKQSLLIHNDTSGRTHLGGVHIELTGDDVTECTGAGLSEADLDQNYTSLCDPRLNCRQALELAFFLGENFR